jgi:hypothetical protein
MLQYFFTCIFFSVHRRKLLGILRDLNAFAGVSYRYDTNFYFISEGEISFLNFQSPYVLELPEIITSHAPSTVYTSQTHAIRC